MSNEFRDEIVDLLMQYDRDYTKDYVCMAESILAMPEMIAIKDMLRNARYHPSYSLEPETPQHLIEWLRS